MKLRNSMLLAAVLVTSQWSAEAAEIRFRGEAAVARGIVRLGDVADVMTADENEGRLLEGIALVPAPASEEPRMLRRQEVQQLLQLSGVSLRQHRFTGAEVTKIQAGDSAVVREPAAHDATAIHQIQVTAVEAKSALKVAKPVVDASPEARVAQAIVAHLNAVSEITAEWQAEMAMSPRVVQAINGQPIVRVEGGISPWLGRQQFMLLVGNEKAPTRLPVEAEITGTARAATVNRTIERGSLISESDVQLQTVTLQRNVRIELDPNNLIGREASRTLNAGQVVSSDMIRTVRLVKRGEELQVVSIGAGLQISEPAKSLGDGSQGDTVEVEFADRRKMLVRVTGPRRAEVYAMQTKRSQVPAAPPAAAQVIRR